MFCPKCGKENNDGSKFCKYCGQEMKQRTGSKNSTNKASVSDNKERNEKIVIGVLIAAIAVLAVVFVAFGMGMFNGDSGDSGSASSQGSSAPASQPVSLSSFPVSQAPALAQAIKNSGGNFPVQFQSLSLSKAQCLYILTKSISLIASGNPTATFAVGDPDYAPHPSGRDASQNIARENYVDMCNRFSSWIESNGFVPNYIGVYGPGVADVSPSRMLDICVSILIDYGNTNNLPASVNI